MSKGKSLIYLGHVRGKKSNIFRSCHDVRGKKSNIFRSCHNVGGKSLIYLGHENTQRSHLKFQKFIFNIYSQTVGLWIVV